MGHWSPSPGQSGGIDWKVAGTLLLLVPCGSFMMSPIYGPGLALAAGPIGKEGRLHSTLYSSTATIIDNTRLIVQVWLDKQFCLEF